MIESSGSWPAPTTSMPPPTDIPLHPITTGGDGGGRRVLIAVVAVLVVVAGAFALVSLQSGGESGAASSEEAVEGFFAALGNEDVIGMLEMVDPAEQAVMRPALERLRDELQRLGLIKHVDLGNVPGLDLTINDLAVHSEELLPGIKEVTLTGGTLTVESVPESIPIGDVLKDLIEATGGDVDNLAEVKEEMELESIGANDFFVTTETDGRWHLSLFFTIAEQARRDAGLDLPDPGAAIAAVGADSPEDAARELVDAAVTLDLERMIALLPPDEARALQLYAPLFLDDAQQEADAMLEESGLEITVDELEFDTSSVDGGTRLSLVGGRGTVAGPDGTITVSVEDDCFAVEGEGELAEEFSEVAPEGEICPGDTVFPTPYDASDAGDFSDDPEFSEYTEMFSDLTKVSERFDKLKPGVVVVERDGKFFVDPLRTGVDVVAQILGLLERDDFQEGGIVYEFVTGFSGFIEEMNESYDDYTEYSDYSDYLTDDSDYSS